ncbi:MAG: hypothetical protein JWM10_4916 [Myxococcaceae bacterium]|nr:hypothetical protein [Myxococcaceae bacterium]
MSDKVNPPPAQLPVVWVFGGGITGLSVAHECIERGYDVYLVEPAEDSWENHLPAVGGVARTQWAYIPSDKPVGSPEAPITRALPFVRHPTFEFSGDEIAALATSAEAPGWAEINDSLTRFMNRLIAATRGAGYQSLTVAISAPMPRRVDPSQPRPGEAKARTKKPKSAAAPPAPADAEWPIEPSAKSIEQAEAVRDAMVKVLKDKLDFATAEDDVLRVEGMSGFRFEVRVKGRGIVPGEHGFRYFPGFYRHLFDTMRRTPVLQRGDDRFGAALRTVFDNLVSTEATWLVVTKERLNAETKQPESYERLVNFPRRPPDSVHQTLGLIESFVRELGYSAQDVSRLTTKLFQYMTSSPERRAGEFEDLTWWDFIEGERFSDVCRRHMELGPEVLGAMTASESEARTQGNCVTQLLIDQLSGRRLTDATLNGPTSVAWFDPWRDYLVYRGVKFIRGELVGFTPPGDTPLHAPGVLLPRVLIDGEPMAEDNFATGLRPHYFVPALPLAAMFDAPDFNLTFEERDWHAHGYIDEIKDRFEPAHADVGYGLARKFRAALDRVEGVDAGSEVRKAGDVDALLAWQASIKPDDTPRDVGLGPLRHLTGVQYLFDTNIQFGQEHTLYMDAAWRLSSISQAHFWRRRPTGIHGYRGIVSVDIGALHRPADAVAADEADWAKGGRLTAWQCTPNQIANTVWDQVRRSIATDTQRHRNAAALPVDRSPLGADMARQGAYPDVPRPSVGVDVEANGALIPSCYHLDENVVFHRTEPTSVGGGPARRAPTSVAKNLTPYLINRPGEWKRRPGRVLGLESRHDGYEIQNGAWVFAGTYMKTFTRLTTMEAANESARHAVNAILRDASAPGDRCKIWDPEDWEHPEFAPLREIDRRLYVDGYPHMVEILGLDSIPEALLPRQLDVE